LFSVGIFVQATPFDYSASGFDNLDAHV
jgi:hypothetical protein